MSDPCCFLCRTPYGCAMPTCEHHLKTERTQDADDQARRTHPDPTGDQAIRNIMRERRRR